MNFKDKNMALQVMTLQMLPNMPLRTQVAIDPGVGKEFYKSFWNSSGKSLWPNVENMVTEAKTKIPVAVPWSFEEWLKIWVPSMPGSFSVDRLRFLPDPDPMTSCIGAHLFWYLKKTGKPVNAIGWYDDPAWKLQPRASLMPVNVYHYESDKPLLVKELPEALSDLRVVFQERIRFSTNPNMNRSPNDYCLPMWKTKAYK